MVDTYFRKWSGVCSIGERVGAGIAHQGQYIKAGMEGIEKTYSQTAKGGYVFQSGEAHGALRWPCSNMYRLGVISTGYGARLSTGGK